MRCDNRKSTENAIVPSERQKIIRFDASLIHPFPIIASRLSPPLCAVITRWAKANRKANRFDGGSGLECAKNVVIIFWLVGHGTSYFYHPRPCHQSGAVRFVFVLFGAQHILTQTRAYTNHTGTFGNRSAEDTTPCCAQLIRYDWALEERLEWATDLVGGWWLTRKRVFRGGGYNDKPILGIGLASRVDIALNVSLSTQLKNLK